ncbi:hypothetical protein EVAR_32933_1 [Eumeta japonica]|uniref:Uncharacterized protein n=1 Tax=Eumeta variegata TaxID=151549 RepID=A0A4C1X4T5_EUMVA|nr:hypothetical protein EVAR_32933_1 [Eumeta japonica]
MKNNTSKPKVGIRTQADKGHEANTSDAQTPSFSEAVPFSKTETSWNHDIRLHKPQNKKYETGPKQKDTSAPPLVSVPTKAASVPVQVPAGTSALLILAPAALHMRGRLHANTLSLTTSCCRND